MRQKNVLFFLGVIFFASLVFAIVYLFSPTSCVGFWTNCNNAFSDDTLTATVRTNLGPTTGIWYNYFIYGGNNTNSTGINGSNTTNITSVRVRADAFTANYPSNTFLDISVSWDGGSTWGTVHRTILTLSEQTYWFDVSSDTIWTQTKLSNDNFRVRAECNNNQPGVTWFCYLDWIPTEVTTNP